MAAPLSAVKVGAWGKKGEKAGKDLSLGAGRGAEECRGGQRRGGNMYGVGKILEQDGRNANINSGLSFPGSESGVFLVEVYSMHPVSSRSCLKSVDTTK